MGSSIFSLPWPFTQFYLHPPEKALSTLLSLATTFSPRLLILRDPEVVHQGRPALPIFYRRSLPVLRMPQVCPSLLRTQPQRVRLSQPRLAIYLSPLERANSEPPVPPPPQRSHWRPLGHPCCGR